MDIKPHSDTIILLDREFDSFEELSHLAIQWDADFSQLSAVQYKSSVFQAMIGSILVSSVSFGCNVEQRGSTPQGGCALLPFLITAVQKYIGLDILSIKMIYLFFLPMVMLIRFHRLDLM